jgi:hypothetical protein
MNFLMQMIGANSSALLFKKGFAGTFGFAGFAAFACTFGIHCTLRAVASPKGQFRSLNFS